MEEDIAVRLLLRLRHPCLGGGCCVARLGREAHALYITWSWVALGSLRRK